ncbi:ArnT family glycosyltransferase [Hydrogenophilus thermoluteolus]|uniref:ArnT family glycosyltransferase n=1 Tax=Hydrogenophilus thermoluteolus TaxID=297 RepID=UPI003F6702F5
MVGRCRFAGGLVALFVRHPFPIDETRYLAVAWEMHWRDVWLMPLLEGEPYVQKPPLLFWLIRLGWLVFDVNAWWPRLLIVFFALGVLWAVAALMRRLTLRSSEKLEQGVPKVPAVPWGNRCVPLLRRGWLLRH